jgi:hypothetical protein
MNFRSNDRYSLSLELDRVSFPTITRVSSIWKNLLRVDNKVPVFYL